FLAVLGLLGELRLVLFAGHRARAGRLATQSRFLHHTGHDSTHHAGAQPDQGACEEVQTNDDRNRGCKPDDDPRYGEVPSGNLVAVVVIVFGHQRSLCTAFSSVGYAPLSSDRHISAGAPVRVARGALWRSYRLLMTGHAVPLTRVSTPATHSSTAPAPARTGHCHATAGSPSVPSTVVACSAAAASAVGRIPSTTAVPAPTPSSTTRAPTARRAAPLVATTAASAVQPSAEETGASSAADSSTVTGARSSARSMRTAAHTCGAAASSATAPSASRASAARYSRRTGRGVLLLTAAGPRRNRCGPRCGRPRRSGRL